MQQISPHPWIRGQNPFNLPYQFVESFPHHASRSRCCCPVNRNVTQPQVEKARQGDAMTIATADTEMKRAHRWAKNIKERGSRICECRVFSSGISPPMQAREDPCRAIQSLWRYRTNHNCRPPCREATAILLRSAPTHGVPERLGFPVPPYLACRVLEKPGRWRANG